MIRALEGSYIFGGPLQGPDLLSANFRGLAPTALIVLPLRGRPETLILTPMGVES